MIKTKAPITVQEYGDRYCLIGPLSYQTAPMEVEALDPPNDKLKQTLDDMEAQGVKYLFGRWLVEGAPYVLLFDINSCYAKLDEWKGDLWSTAGIPSPTSDQETNDAILFGYIVTWFLGDLAPKVIFTYFYLLTFFLKKQLIILFLFFDSMQKIANCLTHHHQVLLLLLISMNGWLAYLSHY